MALFGLAKVTLVMGRAETAPSPDCTRQAVVLYQAAIAADPKNFCAANELGVLFVECGRLEAARDMFIRSVSISPHPATWHNLAVVHGRLGETQLARQAQARADAAGKPSASPSAPNVQWVDAATFAQTTETTDGRQLGGPLTADAANRAGAGPNVGVAQKRKPRFATHELSTLEAVSKPPRRRGQSHFSPRTTKNWDSPRRF